MYCNSCEDDAFVQENIESHSPHAIVERTADPRFYVVEDGKQIIGCGGIIDTGAAQQKAIWFLFSFCLHIRERALEETSLKRWRRMRIFCGPGGQKWVLR